MRPAVLTISIAFQAVFTIQVGIKVFQERAKMLRSITVMTLEEQVIALLVEVSSSLGFFSLTVTTDGTATVVQITALAFEQGQSITYLIQIFNIDVKTHEIEKAPLRAFSI
jgi:hypothetical protein